MTEAERIDLLIKHLEGGNASEFCRNIGKHKTFASDVKAGRRTIRLSVADIIKAYPQVNREWLETGEGYPGDLSIELARAHYEAKIARYEMVIDHLTKRLNDLESRK